MGELEELSMISAEEKYANKWNSISYIIISLVNFFIFTVGFKVFSSDLMGLYVLLNSVFFLGSNLDLGFGVSTIKLISEANRRNDIEYIRQYFFTYLIAYIILTLFILVLQYFYYRYFIKIVISTEIDELTLKHVYVALSINFVFTFMYSYLRSFLEGLFDYVYIAKILILFNIISLILSFVAAFFLQNFILYIIAGSLVSSLIFIMFNIKVISVLKTFLKIKYLNFHHIRININYSSKLQISFFIGNSVDYIIKYLITIFLSLGFVAVYESGKKFTTFINGFIYSTQKALFVKLSELSITKKISDDLKSDIFKYSNLSVRFIFLFYAVLNPCICVFLKYWFDNLDTSIVFLLLALPQTFICFLISFYNVIIYEGRGQYLIIIQILNIVFISLLLMLWFIFFKTFLGLIGYYIATLFTTLIILHYFRKYHGISIKELLMNVSIIKIIILNLLIICEVILIINGLNFFYIMIFSQVTFLAMFFKDLVFLFKKFRFSILSS